MVDASVGRMEEKMGFKDVDDLDVTDAEKLLDLFIHCCRIGTELNMPAAGMAGALQAFAAVLERNKQPLQYYVDNPRGALGRPVNEEEVEQAKREALGKQTKTGVIN